MISARKKVVLGILALSGFIGLVAVVHTFFTGINTGRSVAAANPSYSDWNGQWLRDGSTNFSSSELYIEDSTALGLHLILNKTDGNSPDDTVSASSYFDENRTMSEPPADSIKIEGSHLLFDTLPDRSSPGSGRCTGSFEMSQDQMMLQVKTDCGDYDGTYKRNGMPLIITTENSKIFTDHPDRYLDFKKLVGIYLSDFNGDLQDQEYSGDPTSGAWLGDIAILKTDIKDLGITGLTQFQTTSSANAAATLPTAGTVALGQHGEIWAAVTYYDEKKDQTELLYFTNAEPWKKKLPGMIRSWRTDACYDTDGKCPIVYESVSL